MPKFFIVFLCITFISILFSGMVIWNIIRIWNYRFFYKKIRPYRKQLKTIFFIALILIPIVAIVSQIISYQYYSLVESWIYTGSMWMLGALGYLLMGSTIAWGIAWTLYMIRVATGKKRFTWNRFIIPFSIDTRIGVRILVTLPMIFATAIIIYGTVNTHNIQVVRYEISNQELAVPFPDHWIGQKIGVYSDTHIGQARKQKFLTKVVRTLNNEQPLLTLMAGDLVDGPAFPVKFLEPLQDLNSPLGDYFVPGNHEKYSKNPTMAKILGDYLTYVADDVVMVDGVAIVGLDYRGESTLSAIARAKEITQSINSTTPIIGMMHDPKNIKALFAVNPSLTFSGHTHGGQMWPGNLLVKYLYKEFAYGKSMHNNGKTIHITTSGVGTALVPMRVGTTPEIVIVHINE